MAPKIGILLFNAKRDLRFDLDTWSPLVWRHARELYATHGIALIDALTAANEPAADRLADSLLALDVRP